MAQISYAYRNDGNPCKPIIPLSKLSETPVPLNSTNVPSVVHVPPVVFENPCFMYTSVACDTIPNLSFRDSNAAPFASPGRRQGNVE